MTNLQLVKKYMDIVFSGKNLQQLSNLLVGDCKFIGPFYKFDTAQGLIDSLIKDPPINFNYNILKTYEDDDSVCVIYNFTKSGISTNMVQLFKLSKNKISSIQLIFDTKSFSNTD